MIHILKSIRKSKRIVILISIDTLAMTVILVNMWVHWFHICKHALVSTLRGVLVLSYTTDYKMNKFLNLTKSTKTNSLVISTKENVNYKWLYDLT